MLQGYTENHKRKVVKFLTMSKIRGSETLTLSQNNIVQGLKGVPCAIMSPNFHS